MANLLDLIATQVASALTSAGLTLPATLIKVTPGDRVPGRVSGGTNPTTTSYAAQGLVDSYATALIDGTLIQENDRKILLLGASITSGAIPTNGDQITIEGGTYRVINVSRDPAAATYICQARQ